MFFVAVSNNLTHFVTNGNIFVLRVFLGADAKIFGMAEMQVNEQ